MNPGTPSTPHCGSLGGSCMAVLWAALFKSSRTSGGDDAVLGPLGGPFTCHTIRLWVVGCECGFFKVLHRRCVSQSDLQCSVTLVYVSKRAAFVV